MCFFILRASLYLEHGVYGQVFKLILTKGMSALRNQDRLYASLSEYKNEASHFQNLSIENFRCIFIVFFIACTLVLFIFGFKIVCFNFAILVRKYFLLWQPLCLDFCRKLRRSFSTITNRIFAGRLFDCK